MATISNLNSIFKESYDSYLLLFLQQRLIDQWNNEIKEIINE